MTVLHSGSTTSYADNFSKAFSKPKKKTAHKKTTAKRKSSKKAKKR